MVATVDNPHHLKMIRQVGLEALVYPPEVHPSDMWACWSDEAYVKESIRADLELIERTGAVAIAHDSKLSVPMSAAIAGIGCVSICQIQQCLNFEYAGMGPVELWQRGLDGINRVLASHGQPPVERDLRELYLRGVTMLPSVPEFEPLPEGFPVESARYVGPLTGLSVSEAIADRSDLADDVSDDRGQGVFFYRTIGVNPSLPEFRAAFEDLGDRVYVATGLPRRAEELSRACAGTGFQIRDMWDMNVIRRRAAVSVIHGGHGSCMSCLETGLPAVVLPGDNPERGTNGASLAALGVAVNLPAAASYHINWGQTVETSGAVPPWSQTRSHVNRLAADGEVRARSALWRDRLAALGPDVAVDVIASAEPYQAR
ncbi:MAG TPA: hypothetical protein VFT95_23970 [Micromonosporaceae bacterium]|nr:hypothetical protein [Micromonosporaceae bacterium]